MIQVKLLKWLKKNAGSMSDTEFGRLIGLSQSNVSRHRAKADAASYNPTVGKLAEIVAKLRPKTPLSTVLQEIEKESSPDPRTDEQRRADAAYQVWLRLFEDDPARGERVLANLKVQETLGLTDLVSNVVNLIVTQHDQVKRIAAVTDALASEEKESRGKRFQKIAAAYAEEYVRYQ